MENTNFTIKALHQQLQNLPQYDNTLNVLQKFIDDVEQILLDMQQAGFVDVFGMLIIIEKKLRKWLVEN